MYLYGSAVAGDVKQSSDVDLFAVAARRTTTDERRQLVDRLTPISYRLDRPAGWRPLELTVVALPDLTPWRYPPRTDFQHGEWLRDRYASGAFDPEDPLNPDLAVLIAMVRRDGQSLVGPPAAEMLPGVPVADLRAALLGVLPGLLAALPTDTANVLLTLARVQYTLNTNDFASKDRAADWVLVNLPANFQPALVHARAVYLGLAEDDWTGLESEATVTAQAVVSYLTDSPSRESTS